MERKIFLAARVDGFCARLNAMLNAMVLAELFDGDFRFHWRELGEAASADHCIDSPQETFARSFLAEHYLDIFDPKDFPLLAGPAKSLAEMQDLMSSPGKGFHVLQGALSLYVDTKAIPNLKDLYTRALGRLEFILPLQAAMAAARAVPLPENAVAIHLRAGDVLYGYHRFTSANSQRILCYPVAKRLIHDLVQDGKYPLIFGQDLATCRLLAAPYGLKLACDFIAAPSANKLAMALSELVLMSRCTLIYAAVSAYPMIAGLMGDIAIKNPQRLMKPQDIIETILADRDLADPPFPLPDLQRAFSYYMVAFFGMDLVPDDVIVDNLAKALAWDPVNAYYALQMAKLQTRNGDLYGAELSLRSAVENGMVITGFLDRPILTAVLNWSVAGMRTWKSLELKSYIDALPQFASLDRPYTKMVAEMAVMPIIPFP